MSLLTDPFTEWRSNRTIVSELLDARFEVMDPQPGKFVVEFGSGLGGRRYTYDAKAGDTGEVIKRGIIDKMAADRDIHESLIEGLK